MVRYQGSLEKAAAQHPNSPQQASLYVQNKRPVTTPRASMRWKIKRGMNLNTQLNMPDYDPARLYTSLSRQICGIPAHSGAATPVATLRPLHFEERTNNNTTHLRHSYSGAQVHLYG